MARKMCYDCPHKPKEDGELRIYLGIVPPDEPHECHNAPTLPCVGHQLQLEKYGVVLYPAQVPQEYQ